MFVSTVVLLYILEKYSLYVLKHKFILWGFFKKNLKYNFSFLSSAFSWCHLSATAAQKFS